MKVLVDIDRELAGGHITPAHHARLKADMRDGITELALNILIGFGVIAFTVGCAALAGSAVGLMAEGAAIAGAGAAVLLAGGPRARVFGRLLLVVGLVLFGGALVAFDEFAARAFAVVAILLFGAALATESGLLVALAVLTLSGALGAGSAYEHAEYTLVVDHPLATVGLFGLLAAGCVAAAGAVPRFEGVLTVAARTAALLVNLAFWVGSLWGDSIGSARVPAGVFSVAWAAALLALGVWAWRAGRRWPLVTATVFAAIHFYTQLFERLGANAGTVLLAGLATLLVGLGLKRLAARARPPASPPGAMTTTS